VQFSFFINLRINDNSTEIFHISLYAVCFVGDDHDENTHACRISHSHFSMCFM